MERFYSEQPRKSPQGRRSEANSVTQGKIPEGEEERNAGLAGPRGTEWGGGSRPLSLQRRPLRAFSGGSFQRLVNPFLI